MIEIINKAILEHVELLNKIDHGQKKEIIKISKKIGNCFIRNSTLFLCGNGGSAADAQHLAAEFLVRLRPDVNRKSLPAIALSSIDPSTFTAMINDYDPIDIFKRPFSSLAKKKDILFLISTSGNSKNIIQLAKYARSNNFHIIGLLGSNGGVLKKYCNQAIIIKSKTTARVQEAHITLCHVIAELVERLLFKV